MVIHKQFNFSDYNDNNGKVIIPRDVINEHFADVFSWYVEKIKDGEYKGSRITTSGILNDVGLIIDISKYIVNDSYYRIGVYGNDGNDNDCYKHLTFEDKHHWIINHSFSTVKHQPLIIDVNGNDLVIDNKVVNINYKENKIDIYFKQIVSGSVFVSGICGATPNNTVPIAIINSVL